MHALNDVQYTIYFGGSYAEHWSENYALSIEYKNRRAVTARLENGRWRAAGGDEELAALLESADCPALTRQYFDAAATAYHAAQDWLRRGLTLDRLRECFYADANPLVAPELMRLLMDDCGFAMNVAYNVTAHCCADIRADGVSTDEMYSLQPRTAHIISLLRSAAMCRLAVLFDSRLDTCRRPGGALRCGETVRLAFRVLGGSVRTAALTVYGDAGRAEYPMAREGRDYAAYFTAPDAPQALWFFFRIETDDGTHWLCPDATGFIGRISGRECGGFRLTDQTAYYYNYTPSNKDILNAPSANDKITVIDHDGDNAFDVVLVTTSYPATVTSVSPLTVDVDGKSQTVRAFSSTDVFTVGEEVYYSPVCGSGYIRRLK